MNKIDELLDRRFTKNRMIIADSVIIRLIEKRITMRSNLFRFPAVSRRASRGAIVIRNELKTEWYTRIRTRPKMEHDIL